MRLSSGDVRPAGFRVDSVVSTSNPSERIPVDSPRHASAGSRDGMGWDGKGRKGSHKSDEMPLLTERRKREFEWAAKYLPDEHPGLVVSALIGLEVSGQKQSTDSVMARLEAQGRTAKQRKERA